VLSQELRSFQTFIWQFYAANKRYFAWRNVNNPYYIMISEIMLQQTQTDRVINKFEQFIAVFPDIYSLAEADLQDVLGVWQGLGYNRRGKALWENAQRIVKECNGVVPDDQEILKTFKHIGPNTAASIVAFAFNKPVVFIETNIRTVYLHTFFKDKQNVYDKDLMPLIAQTVDQSNPREWYYALMDYGVYLKKMLPNPNRQSAHYAIQSKFEGSNRQIRGKIIKKLAEVGKMPVDDLFAFLKVDDKRYKKVLDGLLKDGMVNICENVISF
jgi:A/G-specific adenine glycosylase